MNNKYQYDQSLPHCQWWMALTTSMSINDNDLDFMSLGLRTDNPDKTDWLNAMSDGWGVSGREGFLNTIMELIHADVHGDALLSELDFIHFSRSDQWQQYINQQKNDKAKVIAQFAEVLYRHTGLGGIRAWDYCRAGFLIRGCYYCELFSHDEACFLLNVTAKQAQYFYASWEQYLAGSVLGHSYWAFGNNTRGNELGHWGKRLLNNGIGYQYEQFYADLQAYKAFFAALDWHTPLPELAMPESLAETLKLGEEA